MKSKNLNAYFFEIKRVNGQTQYIKYTPLYLFVETTEKFQMVQAFTALPTYYIFYFLTEDFLYFWSWYLKGSWAHDGCLRADAWRVHRLRCGKPNVMFME